jgi:DNA repair protein RecO (recombination protein O)
LLTAEEGIIRATVFGGAKSKLRAHSAPYNSGQVWVYRDPAKDYGKISDFDVQFWRPGLRELYERTMAAGGVAETILSSHGGGGEWGTAMKLATETLDTLENANEELCGRLLIHFLWRWSGFLGIRPHQDEELLNLSPGCRKWLAAVEELEPSALHRYSMDNKSFNEAKSFATAVMTNALGKRLSSWDW